MAEEAGAAVEVADTTTPPPEAEAPEQEQQQQSPSVEEVAGKLGWVPKDQFRGDETAWKPADEFILASRDIQQGLKSEVRGLRDEVSRMSRTSAEIAEGIRNRTIAERDAYWKQQHTRAVEEGDQAAAEKALDERVKLKTATEAPQNGHASVPSETTQFIERNREWFGTQGPDGRFSGGDPLARARVISLCETLAAQGLSPGEQLQQAERAVRKEFPELFKAPAKAPAATQTGQSRSAAPSSGRKKGFADMPLASQNMAIDYETRLGVPREKTAESYWREQEKVG